MLKTNRTRACSFYLTLIQRGRTSLFLALVLGLPFLAKAQVYEPAYIYTLFGDTIRCQIKHIRFITNKTEFRYKRSLEEEKDQYINSKDVLWIITPSDTFECLKVDKGIDKGRVYAYRLLSNGQLRFYSQDRFTKMGGVADYLYYIKKEGMPLREITSFDYKKYLSRYTSDDPESQSELQTLPFEESRIKTFVESYNKRRKSNK